MNRFSFVLIVAGVSGFVSLSYEVLWYRVVSFATWSAPASFGLLLAAYLFGIAIGSRVAALFCRENPGPSSLRTVALFAFAANVISWLVAPSFGFVAVAMESHRWDAIRSWMPPLAGVAVAAGLLGAVLPLICHFAIPADERAGQRLSYVYLANIIGSAGGSFLTGFVFMDFLSTQEIARFAMLLGLGLTAFVVTFSGARGTRLIAPLVVFAASAVMVIAFNGKLYDRLYERLLYRTEYRGQRFTDVVENKSGVIAVSADGAVYGGGAYDGVFNTTLDTDRNGIFRAYALGAIVTHPKRLMMVGLSSGSWAQVLVNFPGVEHLTVIEINPGYLSLIAKHDDVKSLLTNPKVTIVIDDGRRWLNRNPDERFDVIVQNTTWHWRAHISNTLSAEYMHLVHQHLAPNGMFYVNATGSLDVRRTVMEEWPNVMAISNEVAGSDASITFSRDQWRGLLDTMTIDGKPIVQKDSLPYEELYPLGEAIDDPKAKRLIFTDKTIRALGSGQVITDDNMLCEWREMPR